MLCNAGGKIIKYLVIGLCGTEIIQVVRLNRGHHCNRWLIGEQGGIGFIGLGNKNLTGAMMGIGSGAVELTANGKGWVDSHRLQGRHRH